MDRSWIVSGMKFTPPYLAGVEQFMAFVRQHFNENEDILCPCTDCLSLVRLKQDDVMEHIICAGMSITYTRWVYHGEALSDGEGGHNSDDGGYESNENDLDQEDANNAQDDEFQGNDNNYDEVPGLVDELYGL